MNPNIRRFGIVVMLLFVAMVAQLTNLQAVEATRLAHDPRNTRGVVRDFSRRRGSILTADGVVIARSSPSNDIYRYQRQYPRGLDYSFITGYQSLLYGADGVESTYGAELAGRNLPVRVNNLGRLFDASQRFADVSLTLNDKLQQVAISALGQRTGAVVALDPRTGAILALVSKPSYNPNEFASHDTTQVRRSWDGLNADVNRPLLARAFRERYAPGSTFKVITSTSLFDHQPDLANKVYPTLGQLPLPQTTHTLSNFGGEVCGGTLPDLLKFSCNTGFAAIGLDLGGPALAQTATAYGFGARPPFDLPGAVASTFPAPDTFKLNQPSVAFSAIGQQDVTATPLEMAMVAGAIANGGVMMRPHVLSTIRDNDGNVVRTWQPSVWQQVTSPQTATAVNQLMVGVVEGGTGTGAALPFTKVAAKTGTAEVGPNKVNAWMIAFAPADAPRVAIAVVLPALSGVGNEVTGGAVAAPIVKQVLAAGLGLQAPS